MEGSMKYKIGDRVRIKSNQTMDATVYGMMAYCGKRATVVNVCLSPEGYIQDVDFGAHIWQEQFLEEDPVLSFVKEVDEELKKNQRKNVLIGVAPDEPIVTNADGGKQSDTPYGFHLLPIQSVFAAAQVAKYGADKYGETFTQRNYTKIPVEEHINHCIQHLYAYLAGDKQDDHLGHAIVRAMFAFDVDRRKKLECDSGGEEKAE